MAGSQLKQLKEALKKQGLVGQTNFKKKKNRTRSPAESRRQDTLDVIDSIRLDFNKFDQRINRNKRDISILQDGKFVKAGSKQHNHATRTHLVVERNMQLQYDRERQNKGKSGVMLDKRFGESNQSMSAEEKMLERFTRERQSSSRKKNAFALGSDDEGSDVDDSGFTLTHAGKALHYSDSAVLTDTKSNEQKSRYVDQDELDQGPPRKKTKAEVMLEIIVKSKFHKQKRQAEYRQAQEEIMELDEDYTDVMMSMQNIPKPKALITSRKTAEELVYDSKVRELTFERRAVPADRAKTNEELAADRKEKMDKLEADRLKRMECLMDTTEGPEGDDLGDDFWAGSDNDEQYLGSESDEKNLPDPHLRSSVCVSEPQKLLVNIPLNLDEFCKFMDPLSLPDKHAHINNIISIYKPHLAMGNKDKMEAFVGILFHFALKQAHYDSVTRIDESSLVIEHVLLVMRKLSTMYNQVLVNNVRVEMEDIQGRITTEPIALQKRDLVFFSMVGYLFSTSDQYHLIVTPALVLMNQFLSLVMNKQDLSLKLLGYGVFISELLLKYQRISKRYDPEVACFLESAALMLLPESHTISNATNLLLLGGNQFTSVLALSKDAKDLSEGVFVKPISLLALSTIQNDNVPIKFALLCKVLQLMSKAVSSWKNHPSILEVIDAYILILKHAVRYYAIKVPLVTGDILVIFTKMRDNLARYRKPLVLQQHKKLSIATAVPKYEENFNPDKRTYDVNRERQELNKMKAQVKKERKSTLKDLRHETRFVARRQIEEKKNMYDAYHKKMAKIVNSIASTEGAESNQYERDKKARRALKKK